MKKIYKVLISIALIAVMAFAVTGCENVLEGSNANGGMSAATKNVTINIRESEVTPEPTDLVNIVSKIRSSVVEIYVPVSSTLTSSGSGVVIDVDEENGAAYVVTCHHVIENGYNITVKSIDGTTFADIELVGTDPVSDIGVLKVNDRQGNVSKLKGFVSFAKSAPEIGTSVIAIGNPLGYLGGTVTKGIVSAVDRNVNVEGRSMNLIQTDAAINSGNSGGGLFNSATGELVGIVNAGYKPSTAQGLSFAISAVTVKEKVEELIKTASESNSYGYIVGNFDFGVEFTYGTEVIGLDRKYKVVIDSLDKYGLFSKAGLMVGDSIKSVALQRGVYKDEYVIDNVTSSNVATKINELDTWLIKNVQLDDLVYVCFSRYVMDQNGRIKENTFTVMINVKQYIYGLLT